MMRLRSARAVTLIELLVVMSILAMLAGALGLLASSVSRTTNEQRARAMLHKLMAVLELYHEDCGQYPDAINHKPDRDLLPALVSNAGDTPIGMPMIPPARVWDKDMWQYVIVTAEGPGSFPKSSNPNESRSLYESREDQETGDIVQYTELVWALCSTYKGWNNPQLFEHFKRSDTNFNGGRQSKAVENYLGKTEHFNGLGGQLVDPWGRRIFYMSAAAYRRRDPDDESKPASGTTAGGRSGGMFLNRETYQVYCAGEDGMSGLDRYNEGGLDILNKYDQHGLSTMADLPYDDITNW